MSINRIWKRGIGCVICLLVAVTLQAGIPPQSSSLRQLLKVGQPLDAAMSGQIARALAERTARSGLESLLAKQQYPLARRFLTSLAVPISSQYVNKLLKVSSAAELYPNKSFLTDEQVTPYFLSQINRRSTQFLPVIQKRQELIQGRLYDFSRAKTSIFHPQDQDLAWLAEQIPQQTRFLLIGEMHGHPEIALNVVKLLREIRQRNPTRSIILLTEFLPARAIWMGTHRAPLPHPSYFPAWEIARLMGIPVVGLEPDFVQKNVSVLTDGDCNVWSSFEGMRLRNARWMELILNAHENVPDALIVFYGGEAHMGYDWPYSLGNQLSELNPFVVMMYPTYLTVGHGWATAESSPFDTSTFGTFADERILQFNDPELTRLAGFDVQLKVPRLPQTFEWANNTIFDFPPQVNLTGE